MCRFAAKDKKSKVGRQFTLGQATLAPTLSKSECAHAVAPPFPTKSDERFRVSPFYFGEQSTQMSVSQSDGLFGGALVGLSHGASRFYDASPTVLYRRVSGSPEPTSPHTA